MAKARTHQTDVGGFPEYSPAGGIRLPFQEAATSECRRFWAVLTQGNLLDRASTLIVSSCMKGSNKSLGERHARIISDRPAFLQRGGQELARKRPASHVDQCPQFGVVRTQREHHLGCTCLHHEVSQVG